MEPELNQPTSPAIPIAIICGFALIAVAIFFSNSNDPAPIENRESSNTAATAPLPTNTLRALDETDYVRGNPNAPIVMYEYSDYECPFCKQFHESMTQIMDEYGVTGKVAWVYRQMPLTQLHPNAARISESALCVGELGGNKAFWTFSDRLFFERDTDAPTNVTRIPEYLEESGVDEDSYNLCLSSGHNQQKVLDSATEGFDIGVRGTPYTIITVGNEKEVIPGAVSYTFLRGVLEQLINQLEGNYTPPQQIPLPENQPLETEETQF